MMRTPRTATIACIVTGLALLSACGSDGGGRRTPRAGSGDAHTAAEARAEGPTLSTGQVVEPSKVLHALQRTGFQIVFRDGPTPAHFARAIYGTARNGRGAIVNFGFFLTGGANAQNYYEPALRRLVPGATAEGSTVGESYVSITSAGAAGGSSPEAEEEFTVADTLQVRVAALAHQAFEEE
jgi:hypothetical protein